jgi:hypothetical protein
VTALGPTAADIVKTAGAPSVAALAVTVSANGLRRKAAATNLGFMLTSSTS